MVRTDQDDQTSSRAEGRMKEPDKVRDSCSLNRVFVKTGLYKRHTNEPRKRFRDY